MKCPFPGMDPWLEHPGLWPDVHNRLIGAIADDLGPRLAPRYYVALERRAYKVRPDELALIGVPDITVTEAQKTPSRRSGSARHTEVLEVEVPVLDSIEETFLEVHDVEQRRIVTLLEILSPANKVHRQGRDAYERKREEVFASRTNLVEIDLMRDGLPMPVIGGTAASHCDYRILVRRGSEHPRARLHVFSVRQSIPSFPLPLLPGDAEPQLDLNQILHALYERAHFELRLDYRADPVPPLGEEDREWARGLVAPLAG